MEGKKVMDKNSEEKKVNSQEQLLHTMDKTEKNNSFGMLMGIAVILILGAGSGYLLAQRKGVSSGMSGGLSVTSGKTSQGSTDTKTFKDSAEGVLQEGGVDGEGTHKLVRPGGDSQTVYLTSTVLDLNQFVGKKVKVWGETFAAQKAGWLMDVGRVEVEQ